MKLFVWRNTECNRLYSCGNIVAMAASLDEAKAAVLEAAKTATVGYTTMTDLADQLTWSETFAAEAREEIEAVLARVRTDLDKEPDIYEAAHAVFFNGGE